VETDELDWQRGRESNIPDCCIRFYISDWKHNWIRSTHREYMNSAGIISYVPCPSCIQKQRFNSLKLDCGGYHIPVIRGWRYKNNGITWLVSGYNYTGIQIFWIDLVQENDSTITRRESWTDFQDHYTLADKPLTF
jgi:hypothetical protein